MRARNVRPTGQERMFGTDEIIVSKTDPTGVVTYANDASGRVVGYHSNRRCPDRRPIESIRHVYQRMLKVEAGHSRAVDAARAGARMLTDELADAGVTYDRYIWSLISGQEQVQSAA